MAHRFRPARAAVVALLFLTLLGCAPAAPPPAPAPGTGPTVRVLQLNLCNSGIAACYTGSSTAMAAEILRTEQPDVVTFNEGCSDDLAVLAQAMGGTGAAAFQPARDDRTGAPYRCEVGGDYGNGIVSRWPLTPGAVPDAGLHPVQDPDDPEQRAWLCLDLDLDLEIDLEIDIDGEHAAGSGSGLAACTAHLTYTRRDVTRAQCAHLFGTVVARHAARVPVVVGADLNLRPVDPDLTTCLPPGSVQVDDGGPQHVVGSPGLVVRETRLIDMSGTTDHPGMLVTLGPG